MATISDLRAVNATLTTTTVDIVNLTQFWDAIDITNVDAAQDLYITFDGSTPTAAGEGCIMIPRSSSGTYGPGDGITNENGVPGSTVDGTTCHQVRIIGSGNTYSVSGHAGRQ